MTKDINYIFTNARMTISAKYKNPNDVHGFKCTVCSVHIEDMHVQSPAVFILKV